MKNVLTIIILKVSPKEAYCMSDIFLKFCVLCFCRCPKFFCTDIYFFASDDSELFGVVLILNVI
jgi:hypothetical protein